MGEQKAILLCLPADVADEVARLIAATLSMNGYGHNTPSVIDWPCYDEDDEP